MITKDSLQQMLTTAEADRQMHLVGRALVALLNRQTASEQQANATEQHNGVGFAGCDAKSGSLTAKTYLKYGRLEKWQIDKWMRPGRGGYARLCKYHAQLNQIAEEKAARKAVAP